MKTIVKLSLVAVTTLLAACGGSGDSASNEVVVPNTLSGKVVDGYIEGATVCLDINTNLVCDSSEPSAQTLADGSYNLVIPTGLSNYGQLHIIAVIPTTAKDSDDNGLTYAQANKDSTTLMAPVLDETSAVSKIITITPFTTLVSHDVLSGISLKDADDNAKLLLNLANDKSVRGDFSSDESLKKKAKVLTVALGKAEKYWKGKLTNVSDDKVKKIAMLYLKDNWTSIQGILLDANANNFAQDTDTKIKNLVASSSDTNKYTTLLESKALTSDIYATGFFDEEDIQYLFDSLSNSQEAELYKYEAAKGNVKWQKYIYANNFWEKNDYVPAAGKSWILNSTGLVQLENSIVRDYSFIYTSIDNQNYKLVDGSGEEAYQNIREIDMSNTNLASFPIFKFYSSQLTGKTFAKDSKIYLIRQKITKPSYFFNATSAPGETFTSAQDLVSKYSTKQLGFFTSSIQFVPASSSDMTTGTVDYYANNIKSTLRSTTYVIKKIYGVDVIVLKDTKDSYYDRMIALDKTGIAHYASESERPFGYQSSYYGLNKTAINSILAAAQISAFPY